MYESFHEVLGLYLPLACVSPAVRKQPWWLAPLAAVYLASAAFNWYCSYQFQNHRGNSGTRKDWRNWLVNRFVWLSEERHVQVDPMRWFHTVRPSSPPIPSLCCLHPPCAPHPESPRATDHRTHGCAEQVSNDVDEAVKKCWHEHFILINAAVDVAIQIVVAAVVLGWLALIPLGLIIPTLIFMFNISWRKLITRLDKRYSAEDTWMHCTPALTPNP